MSNKTTEEKIDYIYNHIKTERKFLYWRRIFKFLLYAWILGYMYYFIMFGFNNLVDRVVESMKPDISTESLIDWVKNSWTSIINSDTLNSLREKYLNTKEVTWEKSSDELGDTDNY